MADLEQPIARQRGERDVECAEVVDDTAALHADTDPATRGGTRT
jgi:hypothetical protein